MTSRQRNELYVERNVIDAIDAIDVSDVILFCSLHIRLCVCHWMEARREREGGYHRWYLEGA